MACSKRMTACCPVTHSALRTARVASPWACLTLVAPLAPCKVGPLVQLETLQYFAPMCTQMYQFQAFFMPLQIQFPILTVAPCKTFSKGCWMFCDPAGTL